MAHSKLVRKQTSSCASATARLALWSSSGSGAGLELRPDALSAAATSLSRSAVQSLHSAERQLIGTR